MTAPPSLLIYLNSDVAMERPYRTSLPASVDTLAELCQFLTTRIPPRPGEDTVGRGYRFLYSVLGKPLWRVKECVDAGTIVLSVGPGFLARRPTSITDGTTSPLAHNVTPASADDLTTPDRPAPTPRATVNAAVPLDASPSASPPVRIPADRLYSTIWANPPVPATTTRAAAAAPSSAPTPAVAVSSSAAAGAADSKRSSVNAPSGSAETGEGGRKSVDMAWPPAPSVRRPSQTDERDRLVSITLNTAARGVRASSGGPAVAQSTPANATPAVRLFTPTSGHTNATRESTGGSVRGAAVPNPSPPPLPEGGGVRAAAAAASSTNDVPRGMVFLAHETHTLPPRPTFTPSAAALSAVLPYLQPLPATAISSSLQYFFLRKWAAYQRLHSMAPADLIAGEALSQQFNAISASGSTSAVSRPCRVVVSGPPRSGVSTTAAFLLRHLLRTLQFQPQHCLHNTLAIVLDFHLLFGPPPSPSPPHAPPRVLLDLASLYQLVVRAVMDAVVAQRPALREAGPLLSQLWDLVIKPNVEPHVAPNFTTYTQAAALVGGDVLARWTRLAETIFPILQAACRTPHVAELRDAAIDLIFYAIPAEIAASLNFSGLLYAVDGAETLTQCCAQRVTRPAGDLGPLLQSLASDTRTHLVLAWPSTLSPRSLFVPDLTAHISTIGLVPREALRHQHFPLLLRCGAKDYPVEAFLGCPGYLTSVYAVARPFRKNLTIPTTAYSAYYQQHYERSSSGSSTADDYALRIDAREVSHALEQLMAVVQALPAA